MQRVNNINDDIRQMHDQTRSRVAKLKQYRDTVAHNAELFISRTNQLLTSLDHAIKLEESALQPLIDSASGRVSELTNDEKTVIAKAQTVQTKPKEIKEESKTNGEDKDTIIIGPDGKEYTMQDDKS